MLSPLSYKMYRYLATSFQGFHQEFSWQEKGVTVQENIVKEAPCLNRK